MVYHLECKPKGGVIIADAKMWEKLREMRLSSGKTVPEVSKYLQSVGMKAATQTIYGWEKGHSQPTIDTFLEMCKFYGVTDVLSRFRNTPEVSDTISLQEREHIKKYRLLDPYGKEAVDSILNIEHRRCAEPVKQKLYIAARDGSRIETEVDGEIIIPEEDADIPE